MKVFMNTKMIGCEKNVHSKKKKKNIHENQQIGYTSNKYSI